jgi:transcriptional regulator with XRE-family HTH domain
MASGSNVLRVNRVEEQAAYRECVAEMLRLIQAEHKGSDRKPITLLEIAERIDVSLGTIGNAANKKADLSPTYLNRLAEAFGPCTLDPFAAMSGGRIVPREAEEVDAMPSTTAAIHKLAVARSPDSPGGERITHCELLNIEPEIDAAIRSLTSLKVRCEEIRGIAA